MNTQICVKYEGRNSECTVKPIYQYDVGRQLCVSNIDQNAVIQIHYSISGMAKALTDIPTYNVDNKVWMSNVPNALTMQQNEIQAYVYVTGQNNASATVMCVSIPVKPRAKPDGFQYTEAELKGLDFVLSQLADATKEVNDLKSEVRTAIDDAESATTNANNISKNTPYIDSNTGYWMIWDVLTNKYVNTEVPARGKDGEPGKDGQSGVYIGDTEPTDTNINVWINPNGSADIDIDQLAKNVSSLKDQKANVIIDTSARAASHSLHAQDGPLAVTLYGKTTETGTGDKSPDNPYTISGVDTAQVYACGKNLFNTPEASTTVRNVTYTLDGKGNIKISGTHETAGNIFMLDIPNPITIQPGMRIVIDATEASGSHGLNFRNTKTGDARTINAQAGKVVTFDVGANHAGQTFNHFRDWLGPNTVYNDTLKIMFTYSSDNTFEPYTANTITPPLLPDGSPLMGNGTVDDTVENDVPSGCDVKLTFKSADGWRDRSPDLTKGVYSYTPPLAADAALVFFSNKAVVANAGGIANANKYPVSTSSSGGTLYVYFPECTTLEELDAYFAANPLTVYYRSTDYTPDKDLRVCKTVRRKRCRRITGSEIKGPITVNGYTAFRFGLKDTKPEANRVFIMSHFTEKWACNPGNFRNNFGNDYNVELVISEDITTIEAAKAWFDENNVYAEYNLATPETYMTDPLDLRKPTGIMPVTVMGSAETAVTYPHETKHYIDSQIAAAVALALGN